MKVYIEKDQKTHDLAFQGPVKQLLEQLGIAAENVLIVRDGELITEEDDIGDDVQEVKFLSVVSGG